MSPLSWTLTIALVLAAGVIFFLLRSLPRWKG